MFRFSRILVAYLVAIPLALFLGFLVTTPDQQTIVYICVLVGFMMLPLLLRWHHTLMILFWNAAFIAFFIPAQPDIWLPLAAASFSISMLNHIMFQKRFLRARELTTPLLFLGVVVLVTAWCRGGIGLRVMGGGAIGGRYYIFVLTAILGYFAMTAEPVPAESGGKFTRWFFLGGTTAILSNVIYILGPSFYFLYTFVSTGGALSQVTSDATGSSMDRLAGLAPGGMFGLCYLYSRFGLRGLFDWSKPWRFGLLMLIVASSFFGGFRSAIIALIITTAFQFYFERLFRTHYLPLIFGMVILCMTPVLLFSESMPGSVQRAISFLPVKVDSDILADAKGSQEWRYGMWRDIMKDAPKYLLLGKGYGMDPTELFLVNEASRLGLPSNGYDAFIMAGDYHSGPLSILIPFGIFGVICFGWVLWAGGKVLLLNYRFGDPRLKRANTILLSYYLGQVVMFFFIFGAFNTQLYTFLGTCGLSVSLNGGVKRRFARKRQPASISKSLALQPG